MALTTFKMKKIEGPKAKPVFENQTFQRTENVLYKCL